MGRSQVQSHGAPICSQVTTIMIIKINILVKISLTTITMIVIIKINILVKISLTSIIITAKWEDTKCRAPVCTQGAQYYDLVGNLGAKCTCHFVYFPS